MRFSVFQLAYTTLFGIHTSFLFLRTGSVWPTITAHIFCNIMGIPELGHELQKFKERKSGERPSSIFQFLSKQNFKVIITMYLVGIFGFVYTMTRWTRTPGNLYWPLDGHDISIH
jgi:prenyl protein peptidase